MDVTLVVDPGGGAGTYEGIQEALDAADEIATDVRVTISVEPGSYTGPFTITRANTALVGNSDPQFDGDGYITEFTNPVNIGLDADPAPTVSIINVQANDVTVSGLNLSGEGVDTGNANGGIAALIVTPTTHLKGLVFTENVIENIGLGAIEVFQADATITKNRSVTGSFLGIVASGSSPDGDAVLTIDRNWVERKNLGICTIGSVFDLLSRGPEFGDSGMVATVTNNYIADSERYGFNFPSVEVAPNNNPTAHVTYTATVTGNTVVNSGLAVFRLNAPSSEDDARFETTIMFDDNTFTDNPSTAFISFQGDDGAYITNSRVELTDPDNTISAEEIAAADLGPPENNNVLIVN